jgi:hypothetical protein
LRQSLGSCSRLVICRMSMTSRATHVCADKRTARAGYRQSTAVGLNHEVASRVREVVLSMDGSSGNGSVGETFRQAWIGAPDADTANPELLPVRLARACVDVLDVDGAGLSFFYSDFRVPVGASDDLSTTAERLQFTQGEGPCLASAATHRILVSDADDLQQRWPTFSRELFSLTPFRAIVSVPLAMTRHSFAALDLYLTDPAAAGALTLPDVYSVGEQIVHALTHALNEVLETDTEGGSSSAAEDDELMPAWLNTAPAQTRTLVWVAMGMAMAKYDLTATDAIALLRAYAYGHDQLLDDVASSLIDGDLTLAEMQP